MPDFLSNLQIMASPKTSRLMDLAAMDFGVPEIMLMENAARAAADVMEQNFGDLRDAPVWLFMGNGNNGGDAAALARNLADRGARPTLFCLKKTDQYSGAPAVNLDLALRDNVPIALIDAKSASSIFANLVSASRENPAIIVDGLLGTGFAGELKPELATLIGKINEFARINRVRVLALDIPSGLDAMSGEASPVAIRADITVTFAAYKSGLGPGRQWTGDVFVRDVGFPHAIFEKARPDGLVIDGRALLAPMKFTPNSYKNVYGSVALIGGAPGMGGAICLAALAALRAGAGLVTVCAPSCALPQIRNFAPEIMTLDPGENWEMAARDEVIEKLIAKDAIVVGPGMGSGGEKFLNALLSAKNRPPAIIDADALKSLSRLSNARKIVREHDILTPHPGEAGVLLDWTHSQVQSDRRAALARLIDAYDAVCVLKGAYTLIGQTGKTPVLCPYDLPRLAIGGAGDVLAGCLGALLARRDCSSSLETAARGVILHALTALMLGERFQERGLIAEEVSNSLPQVLSWVRKLDKTGLQRGLCPWPGSF